MVKHLLLNTLACFAVAILFNNHILPSPVTFKVTVKNEQNVSVSRTYIKLFIPGNSRAVDSMFTDSQGYVERVLTFVDYHVGIQGYRTDARVIVRKLSPNIISQNSTDCSLEYRYPYKPELFFVDVYGRTFPNHAELSPGVYFYYLTFSDGTKSEINRMVVTARSTVKVNLISNHDTGVDFQTRLKTMSDVERFYAVLVKDRFVTKKDTIFITNSTINRNYQLTSAPKPVAEFSFSGNLKTGAPVLFDASASVGANHEKLIYSWDFGNGKKGQSSGIPHIYAAAGNYNVTLTVSGDYGASAKTSKTITIVPSVVPTVFTGKVKGYITDRSAKDLSNATVSLVNGDASAVSDQSGMVSLTNLPVSVPLYFSISKSGYVSQVITLTIPESKESFFFTTLQERDPEIILPNAEYGGKILGKDGAALVIPVDGLVKPDGSMVTGSINVSVTSVDVSRFSDCFPGSFNAFRGNGEDGVLLSYGVSEYQFRQGTEILQLAPGKTATVEIPIYTSGAKSGDEILLWSINESNGIWVEEGYGTVISSQGSPTALALKADIGHLSWWNCDAFDRSRDRDVLCWRWECTSAQCYRVKVGCWMSGAMYDNGTPASPPKSKKMAAVAVPPVFAVKTFVEPDGNKLKFPALRDVYLEARGFDAKGDIMNGKTIVYKDLSDTVKIELISGSSTDTLINISINTDYQYYLEKGKSMKFRVNLPKENVYSFILNQGTSPSLKGMFSVRDSKSIRTSGNTDGNAKYTFTKEKQLILTVSGQNQQDMGNFTLKVRDPVRINIKDSVPGILTAADNYKFYSLKPDSNMVLLAGFQTTGGSSGITGRVKLFSQGIQEMGNSFLHQNGDNFVSALSKDSLYFFELTRSGDCNFALTTKEDQKYWVSYGDTLKKHLRYRKDMDMFHFKGQKNDIVSIHGMQPDNELSGGTFELWDTLGHFISKKGIYPSNYSHDREIIYLLPSDGKYTFLVSSSQSDTGSYQMILKKPVVEMLPCNTLTKINVLQGKEYYFQFELPEKKYAHFSVQSETDNGTFDVWNSECRRLTEVNYYLNQPRNSFYPLFDTLPAGRYYVKIRNNNAAAIHINLSDIKSLNFDNKGLAQRKDTLIKYRANAYYFYGSPGDGIHAILKRFEESKNPSGLSVRFYKSGDKDDLNIQGATYRDRNSMDSTLLGESATTFTGTLNNALWILSIAADNPGIYDLSFHHVRSGDSIAVDDDFVQIPGAHASSLVAAGYAIRENGKLYVANGNYTSYLPVVIKMKNVRLTGQEKDKVHINSVYDFTNTGCIDFESQGGTIRNVTLSSGPSEGQSVLLAANNITFENVEVSPLSGKTKVYGTVKGSGSKMRIRNITMNNTVEGFNIGSDDGIIENCSVQATSSGVHCSGKNMVVRNNTITLNNSYRAIVVEQPAGSGNCRIDSNYIKTNKDPGSGIGILEVHENGTGSSVSSVRHNTILTDGSSSGIYAVIGNAPSRIMIENNTFNSTLPGGAKAFYIANGWSSGGSSVIVRNNVFDGLMSNEAIVMNGVDMIPENQMYAIYNNNFRMAVNASHSTSNHFIFASNYGTTFTGTARVNMVNNIFQGDGYSSFIKFKNNFSLTSDYNVLYNFSSYNTGTGTILGKTHDIADDPKYTGDNLHVDPTSPAINHGAAPAQYLNIPETDMEGTARPQGSGFDIGAYEKKE